MTSKVISLELWQPKLTVKTKLERGKQITRFLKLMGKNIIN